MSIKRLKNSAYPNKSQWVHRQKGISIRFRTHCSNYVDDVSVEHLNHIIPKCTCLSPNNTPYQNACIYKTLTTLTSTILISQLIVGADESDTLTLTIENPRFRTVRSRFVFLRVQMESEIIETFAFERAQVTIEHGFLSALVLQVPSNVALVLVYFIASDAAIDSVVFHIVHV